MCRHHACAQVRRLFSSVTNVVQLPKGAAAEADLSEAEIVPLQLYDPAEDTDEQRKASCKVRVPHRWGAQHKLLQLPACAAEGRGVQEC